MSYYKCTDIQFIENVEINESLQLLLLQFTAGMAVLLAYMFLNR